MASGAFFAGECRQRWSLHIQPVGWVNGLIVCPTLITNRQRWELIKALSGVGPVSIREAARRVGRDVKAVHGAVTALVNAGLIKRIEGEGIEFPFDTVKVEFLLNAA